MFCTNCGNSVDPGASFCARCGTAQPRRAGNGPYTAGPHNAGAPYNVPAADFLDNISSRTASILCYIPIFGAIPAIVFLASQKFRTNARVRFDAFQSVYLFVAWLIVSSAIPVLMFGMEGWGIERAFVGALKLLLVGCWIYLLVKASQEVQVRVPILGDLAARSTTEQL